jgi:ion channel-forming bestrophin family protein
MPDAWGGGRWSSLPPHSSSVADPFAPCRVFVNIPIHCVALQTNAAYDRYWEARKIWGALVNSCRNMGRLCTTSMRNPASSRAASRLVVSFSWALAQRLQQRRSDEPCASLLAPYPTFEARVRKATNKPLECLQCLGELVQAEFLSVPNGSVVPPGADMQVNVGMWNAEECLREMLTHLGASERICTCPVPLSYSRHATRMISIFLQTLPLLLVGQPGGVYICVPACVLLTWTYCGVDEVARMIEDPFRGEKYSLDIDTLCAKIENDLLEQVSPERRPGREGVEEAMGNVALRHENQSA